MLDKSVAMPPNMILQSINFLKVSSGKRSDRGAAMNGRRKGTLVLGGGVVGGGVKTRCQTGCSFIYEPAGGGELWDGYSQPL